MQEVVVDTASGQLLSRRVGAFVRNLTLDTFVVQTGGAGQTLSVSGARQSGYLRVIAVAFD